MSDPMSVPGMMNPADDLTGATGSQLAPNVPEKAIPRTPPEATAPRKALVKQKLGLIKAAEKHWSKAFKRMEEDQDFAYKWGVGAQWENQTENDQRYIANVVQRHINTRVAALYAKNPTVVAKPKRRKEYKVWDGSLASVQRAQMQLQQAGMQNLPIPPDALELLTDIQQGMIRKKMIQGTGETLEILFSYFMKEQVPDFKNQMKQLVRRTETCGVGYVELGYQRLFAPRPDHASRIADVTDQMQTIDRLQADQTDGVTSETSPEAEELELALQEIKSEPQVIVREGLTWNWPSSTSIIPDIACTQLVGFVGARWVAKKMMWTPNEIKEIFKVDINASAEANSAVNTRPTTGDEDSKPADPVAVYCFYDRKTALEYYICEGYQDFLTEPAAPSVRLEQFFPIYVLAFNTIEHPKELFPPSDVRLLRSQQLEYNRIKESLRQHRIANRPLYALAAGSLEDEDKEGQGQLALDNYPAHAVLELQGLAEDQKIGDKLQAVPKVPVDPNLYESEGTFTDMERVTGSAEANLGGTSGATATESNISEGSRLSSLQSNADDLDSLLTLMARDGGQILMLQCSAETVEEIVGPGAVWPEMSRADVVKELYLDIEAGSSGRPNRAVDIANFQTMGPLIMQIPGITPEKLARYGIKIMDDTIDVTDWIDPGLPSITTMNGQKQMAPGDPGSDPNMQGPQGGQNAPVPAVSADKRPALPAPSSFVA